MLGVAENPVPMAEGAGGASPGVQPRRAASRILVGLGVLGVAVALAMALVVFVSMRDPVSAVVVAIVFGFPAALVVALGMALAMARDGGNRVTIITAAAPLPSTRFVLLDTARPTFEAFLHLVATASDADLREAAELERVPDWRRDRDPALLIERFRGSWAPTAADRRGSRERRALRRAQSVLGHAGMEAARGRARDAIDARSPSWPRMGLHRPLHAAAGAGIGLAAISTVLGLAGFLHPPADRALLLVGSVLAAGAILWGYLLPPSAADLRRVLDRAAVAHAAGDRLEDGHFAELTDGFYAVLEGRWRRGARPYGAWAGLFLTIAVLALMGAVLVPSRSP